MQQPSVSAAPATQPDSNGQSSMQSPRRRSPLPEIRQNPTASHMPAYAPSPTLAARPPSVTQYHSASVPRSATHAAVAMGHPIPPQGFMHPTAAVVDRSRLTTAEKGKGRASPYPSTMASTTILAQTPPAPYVASTPSAAADLAATDSLQGKRVPKKRRLSANGEIDPESLQSDGTLKKSRKRPSGVDAPPRYDLYNGHASSSSHPPPSTGATHHPVSSTEATAAPSQPRSAADRAYVERLQRNAEKRT